MTDFDPVQRPKHYNSHPSGIQAIEICRLLPFSLGNAVKYVFRSGIKDPQKTIEDYEKAIWYLNDFKRHSENWIDTHTSWLPFYSMKVKYLVDKIQDRRDGVLEGFFRALFSSESGSVTRSSIDVAILFLEGAIDQERANQAVSPR